MGLRWTYAVCVTAIQISALHLTRRVAIAEAKTANAARQHTPACRWHSRYVRDHSCAAVVSRARDVLAAGQLTKKGTSHKHQRQSSRGILYWVVHLSAAAHSVLMGCFALTATITQHTGRRSKLPEEVVLAWKEYRSKNVKAAVSAFVGF